MSSNVEIGFGCMSQLLRRAERKNSSLWRGPYTIIDKTSSVNYRIQLIGTTKSLVVHQNRLKLCFGEPQQYKRQSASPQNAAVNQDHAGASESHITGSEPVTQPSLPAVAGGYTSSFNEDTTMPAEETYEPVDRRPQRAHRPPSRYDDFVPIGDEDVSD